MNKQVSGFRVVFIWVNLFVWLQVIKYTLFALFLARMYMIDHALFLGSIILSPFFFFCYNYRIPNFISFSPSFSPYTLIFETEQHTYSFLTTSTYVHGKHCTFSCTGSWCFMFSSASISCSVEELLEVLTCHAGELEWSVMFHLIAQRKRTFSFSSLIINLT